MARDCDARLPGWNKRRTAFTRPMLPSSINYQADHSPHSYEQNAERNKAQVRQDQRFSCSRSPSVMQPFVANARLVSLITSATRFAARYKRFRVANRGQKLPPCISSFKSSQSVLLGTVSESNNRAKADEQREYHPLYQTVFLVHKFNVTLCM